jgi:hypothetical protein
VTPTRDGRRDGSNFATEATAPNVEHKQVTARPSLEGPRVRLDKRPRSCRTRASDQLTLTTGAADDRR